MRGPCQHYRELMDDFLSGELLVETNHEMLGHLAACETCRVELARRERIRLVLRSAIDRETLGDAARRHTIDAVGRAAAVAAPKPTRALSVRPLLTAAAALIVALAVFSWQFHESPVSAAELVSRSTKAEALVVERGRVVHRVTVLEERRLPEGTLVSQRRIEVWQAGDGETRARRAFDGGGRLIAGEWTRTDGSSTVYYPGIEPKPVIVAGGAPPDSRLLLNSEDVWRLELSTRDFSRLIALEDSVVERTSDSYRIRYEPPPLASASRGSTELTAATITLNRQTLWPTEQVLRVRRQARSFEYRFTETFLERVPTEKVTAPVFQPDAALLTAAATTPTAGLASVPSKSAAERAERASAPWAAALNRLEIEAAYRLHRFDVCLNGADTVTRAPDGLHLTAVLDSEARLALVRQSLDTLDDAADLHVDLSVEPRRAAELPVAATAIPASGESQSFPAAPALRAYLARSTREGPKESNAFDSLDAAVQQFVSSASERSLRVVTHAQALKQLMDRWPSKALQRLDLDSLAMWQSMMRDHIRSMRQESDALRAQLQPVLFADVAFGTSDHVTIARDVSDLSRMIATLVELAADQREIVRAQFTPGASAADSGAAKARLGGTLKSLEHVLAGFSGPWLLIQ